MAKQRGLSAQGLRIKELLEELIDKPVDFDAQVDYGPGFAFDVPESEREGMTYGKLLVRRLLMMACSGNDKAIQEVLDRVVGKPVQVQHNLNVEATYEDLLRSFRETPGTLNPPTIDVPVDPRQALRDELGL